MELRDFVAQSLKQIMEAVAEAQEHAERLGGYVVPLMPVMGRTRGAPADHRVVGAKHATAEIQSIEFDVAVTAAEGKTAGGEGGLKVAGMFSAGGTAKRESTTESVSRIRFTVPVILPHQRGREQVKPDPAAPPRRAATPTPPQA